MKACNLLRFCYNSNCCTNSAEISLRRERSSTSEARLCRSAPPTQHTVVLTIPVHFGTEWQNLAKYFASIRPVLNLAQDNVFHWTLEAMSDSPLSTKGHPLSKMQVQKCVTVEFDPEGDWGYRPQEPMRSSFGTYSFSSRCCTEL